MFAVDAPSLFALLLAGLVGWVAITWLAVDRLARRRGLTGLAAALDPRSWLVEPVLGFPAWVPLLLWPVVALNLAQLLSWLAWLAAR